jgi:tetraacyldisaccharide 4'-kinase
MISFLFKFLTCIRNLAYDLGFARQATLPGTVYSVGNLAVGGTGKTPVVIALVKHLKQRGHLPAVLTRGYGSSLKKNEWIVLENGAVVGGNANPIQLPDEARLQSVECIGVPVIAGADRLGAAKAYLTSSGKESAPTHWVLDDGFQHRRIRREVDIVLMDKSNPIGSGWLLPFGFLREPFENLKRATHVFFTGSGTVSSDFIRRASGHNPGIKFEEIFTKPETLNFDIRGAVKFSDMRNEKFLVVACIARPERLIYDLNSDGIFPAEKLFLSDHQPISAKTLTDSLGAARAVITTAKDYWRNPEIFSDLKIPVFIKKIEIVLPESLVKEIN